MKKLYLIFAVFSLLFIGAARAASDGCGEDEGNDFIHPMLALCSTHAYNIGAIRNPTSPEDRQLMQDAIALKATIATQQMKRQYDFLDATMKRFKVQLEKAILTAQAQAAGAAAPESGAGSGSSNKSAFLDCSIKTDAELGTCIRQNLNSINSEFGSKADTAGVSAALRRQLRKDADAIEFIPVGSQQAISLETVCKESEMTNVGTAKKCVRAINGKLSQIDAAIADRNRPVRY